MPLERAGEVALVGKSAIRRHVCEWHTAAQGLPGLLNAQLHQIGVGREAGALLKGADEMIRAEAGGLRQIFKRDVFVAMGMQEFFCSKDGV